MSWVNKVRDEALSQFKEQGFPTKKNEAWKYTPVSSLVEITPSEVQPKKGEVSDVSLKPFLPAGMLSHRIVLVDGYLEETLSFLGDLPEGVIVKSLATAFEENASALEEAFQKDSHSKDNIFSTLNAAYFKDGVFVYIPKEIKLEWPIHIISLSSSGLSYVRNVIVADEKSHVMIVETYGSHGEGNHVSNGVTECLLNEASSVEHYVYQGQSRASTHLSKRFIYQKAKSHYYSHLMSVGASLSRADYRISFEGSRAECELYGLFSPAGSQHMDHHVVVDHQSSHCRSDQQFKGVIADKGTGVFNGKIFIREQAKKTEAHQTNKNILLSENATVYAKPHLEIYADDVKCTHGSSTGQLDKTALFYLRSRGIKEEKARKLLTEAFSSDIIDRARLSPYREWLRRGHETK